MVLGSSGHHDHHGHTAYRDVDRVLSESDLEPDAKDFARGAFRPLAEAAEGSRSVEGVKAKDTAAGGEISDELLAEFRAEMTDALSLGTDTLQAMWDENPDYI